MRLDQYLVELKKMRSRTQAKEFIQQGKVKVSGVVITKASHPCEEGCLVEIVDDEGLEWVARSGQKLYGALESLCVDLRGKTCLDVGQSTGGFTQAMLKRGAKEIVGIDVGRGQLNTEIKGLPNVHCYEAFDARDLGKLKEKWVFDFFAVDVS
ncbi:MAG: SAM-dependent methyltransferase, partial [Bdellovibrionales bacterium]